MKENDDIIGNVIASDVIRYLKKLNIDDRRIWMDKIFDIFCSVCGEDIKEDPHVHINNSCDFDGH
jgi:hypothetical protein